MAYTLQQTINWAQTFIEYSPLTAGVNNEPSISIASTVRATILNAPFVWPWNRAENSSLLTTTAGVQDYTIALTDFAYLEKVSLANALDNYKYELKDVYNTNILGVALEQQQPKAVAVKSVIYGTNVSLRFLGVPDQAYTGTVTYQQISLPFSTLSGTWAPIPDSFLDCFNNLFLAEAFQAVDDARGAQYRQRGIASLLSKAEGLTELQRSAFLSQWMVRDSQSLSNQLRTQQGNQARAI